MTQAESSAPRPAIRLLGQGVSLLDKDLQYRIERYRAAMSLANEMLTKNVISQEEYAVIDTIMTKKYGVTSSTIFR